MCGYGEDCASALRGPGGCILFAECDPSRALQTFHVLSRSSPSCLRSTSLFPQRALITLDHKKKLKNNTLVGNTGHLDNEKG